MYERIIINKLKRELGISWGRSDLLNNNNNNKYKYKYMSQ